MFCVSWNFEGVIHWEFVPNGRAVDADLHSQQLERVHEILRRRYPALVHRKSVILQQDNGRLHTALTTMTEKQGIGWNRTATTPSIQSWSCAFRLLSFSIHDQFCCVEERKLWSCGCGSHRILASKTRDWCRHGIRNLPEKWLRTMVSHDFYFEETISSRWSFSRQCLLSQWPSQFLFLFFIISSVILPSTTLSSTTAFFILSVHFHAPSFSISSSQMY